MSTNDPSELLPTSCDSLLNNDSSSASHLFRRGWFQPEDDDQPAVVCRGANSSVIELPADDMISEMRERSDGVTSPLYSEMQRSGQVRVVVVPTTMRQCPSTVSMVSCAKSETDSSATGPTCRICDSSGDATNRLISPCRCSGTSKFVHEQCLNKWLETINARSAPRCEVCRYHIHTRKSYRVKNFRTPPISPCDLVLHLIFFVAVIILIVSGIFTIVGFVSNHSRMSSRRPGDSLAHEDVVVLIGGLTFFVTFITALLTQIRASQSLYKLFNNCVSLNTEWRIDAYHRSQDSLNPK